MFTAQDIIDIAIRLEKTARKPTGMPGCIYRMMS